MKSVLKHKTVDIQSRIIADALDIEGKDVLVVEDIVDSGRTLAYLIELLKKRGPRSVKICSLLDKPSRREVDVKFDYTCFEVPNVYIVGFGLDHDQKYRNLPYIGGLKFE